METNEFLHNVYGSLRDGYLSVTILENGKSRTRWFDTGHLDEMAAYAVEAGKTCNTYFGVNPRTTALGEFRRGDREDISAVIGTYTDFDIKGDAHKEKNLPETKEVLMGFLMALPIQPTIIIESGNGIHAYWLFKEIFYIGNESDRDYIEKIVKGWESFVKDKAFHERGWKFDSVSDLPRMLRAIGTVNHKTVERPISIVASFTEDRYSPSDFEGYTSAQPAKKSAGTTETYGSKVWHSNDPYRKVIWQCNSKFKNEEKCRTPHVTEERLKDGFLEALSILHENRETLLNDIRDVKHDLEDCTEVNAKITETAHEMEVIAGLIQKSIEDNAVHAQDQEEYNRRYNELADHYEKLKNKLEALEQERDDREYKSNVLSGFLFEMTEFKYLDAEFTDARCIAMLDHVTIYADGRMIYSFLNGSDITVML